MSFFGSSSPYSSISKATTVNSGSIEVADPPTDSISSIAFSGAADYLAVGSWDSNVRIYEVGPAGQSQGKAMFTHGAPVLGVCWSKDGNKVFSCGTDNAARAFDVASGTVSQVAQHDAPVKSCRWVDTPQAQAGLLATGSWDKTIKYWDLRSPAPVLTVTLPERCYSFDVQGSLMVAATAERHIQVFDLTNPTTPFKTMQSPLKWQTRVVSCGPSSDKRKSFAIGSVEGRVAIQYPEAKEASNSYTFRCHRRDTTPSSKDQAIVFAVNDISFHPVTGIFSTCGSDGTIHFWDGDARVRIKSFDAAPGPISTSCFNKTGSLFAYAVSYDWYQGYSGMTPTQPNKLIVHLCKEEETKKRVTRK